MVEVTSSSSSHQLTRRKPGRASSNWKTLQTTCVHADCFEPTDLKILSQVLPQVPAAVKARNAQRKKSRISNHFITPYPVVSTTSITPSTSSNPTTQKLLDILQKQPYSSNISNQTEYATSSFEDVTRKVADLIQDKILIGHAISNDLQQRQIPGLKKLALLLLDIEIQKDSHCSVCLPSLISKLKKGFSGSYFEKLLTWIYSSIRLQTHIKVDDARATLAIYRTQKDQWESLVKKEQALAKKEQVRQQTRPPA
ncbi:hypothetical protein KEM48_001464 [Puccinia striiformis f. sp. tritici PST-130]|nr:hypothetical protein KEM48_001464 [Puccinia striiformis f. sp. tritici PST-130]